MLKRRRLPTKNISTSCLAAIALAFCLNSVGYSLGLILSSHANRLGLQRVWFAQVGVDTSRSHIVDWKLRNDRLYSLSSGGTLQALDAETGATLWTVRIASRHDSFAGLGVNDEHVAVINGTYLHLFDTAQGHLRVTHRLGSAPAAAPILSEKYVFAAMFNGIVEAYSLQEPSAEVWYHQSIGRIFYSPTATGKVVSWPTDRGFLYVSQANNPRVLFRVETDAEIVAQPTELDPYLYITSRDGYIYCVNELTGAEEWRYSTGFPIVSKPAVVAKTAYVASQEPALHAAHFETGKPRWEVRGISQFASEGAKNVYGMDKYGSVVVIEKETGGILGHLRAGAGTTALVNDQSDSLFLVNDRGLVQCLRESGGAEVSYYRLEPAEEEEEQEPETDVNPFARQDDAELPDEQPAELDEVPFQPAEDPADEPDDDDNPFF